MVVTWKLSKYAACQSERSVLLRITYSDFRQTDGGGGAAPELDEAEVEPEGPKAQRQT